MNPQRKLLNRARGRQWEREREGLIGTARASVYDGGGGVDLQSRSQVCVYSTSIKKKVNKRYNIIKMHRYLGR